MDCLPQLRILYYIGHVIFSPWHAIQVIDHAATIKQLQTADAAITRMEEKISESMKGRTAAEANQVTPYALSVYSGQFLTGPLRLESETIWLDQILLHTRQSKHKVISLQLRYDRWLNLYSKHRRFLSPSTSDVQTCHADSVINFNVLYTVLSLPKSWNEKIMLYRLLLRRI